MTQHQELVTELRAAHMIIQSALQIMSPEQRRLWAERNDVLGLVESGATRANERDTLLARCL